MYCPSHYPAHQQSSPETSRL